MRPRVVYSQAHAADTVSQSHSLPGSYCQSRGGVSRNKNERGLWPQR